MGNNDEQKKETVPLKTVSDIGDAYEWLYNKQVNGQLDAKAVDGINTTLKGQTYLKVKLKMDYLKLMVQAKKAKVDLPETVTDILIPDMRSNA